MTKSHNKYNENQQNFIVKKYNNSLTPPNSPPIENFHINVQFETKINRRQKGLQKKIWRICKNEKSEKKINYFGINDFGWNLCFCSTHQIFG